MSLLLILWGAGSVSLGEGVLADSFAERKEDKKKKKKKEMEEEKRKGKQVGLAGLAELPARWAGDGVSGEETHLADFMELTTREVDVGVSGGKKKKKEKKGKKRNERIEKGEQINTANPMEWPVRGIMEERVALVDGEEIVLADPIDPSMRGAGTVDPVEEKIDLDGLGSRRRKSTIPRRLARPMIASADLPGEGDDVLASLMEGLIHEVSRKKRKGKENPPVLAEDHVVEEVAPSRVMGADLAGSSVREEIHLVDSVEVTTRLAREGVSGKKKKKKKKRKEEKKARGEGEESEKGEKEESERREEEEREESEQVTSADFVELSARGTIEEICFVDFVEGATRAAGETVFGKKKKKQKKREEKKKAREEEKQVDLAGGLPVGVAVEEALPTSTFADKGAAPTPTAVDAEGFDPEEAEVSRGSTRKKKRDGKRSRKSIY